MATNPVTRNPEESRARLAHGRVARMRIVVLDVRGKEAAHADQGTSGG